MKSKGLNYTIAGEVFTRFPGYVRGVVRAYGVTNGPSSEEVISLMRESEAELRGRLKTDDLAEHPRMVSWRDAYRAFGVKPTKFRPSMEAMARRVLKDQEIPSINMLVDIGNIVSLRFLVPAGGHAVDVMEQDVALRPATGEEEFTAFGSDLVENPVQGEIILVEGNTVLTRRWTWRQANHTLVLPTTVDVEVNVDGLPPVPATEVEEACRQVIELIERFCGGTTSYEILSAETPTIKL
ncbi:MAG: phenylalanine--tRNA ligase beta subunit-related protein [Desulfomonilaceae bacterium]|nr:phenylalanine--tRNA ligase beta subunit-related protein [Desulfomonilaceae bacterium]